MNDQQEYAAVVAQWTSFTLFICFIEYWLALQAFGEFSDSFHLITKFVENVSSSSYSL